MFVWLKKEESKTWVYQRGIGVKLDTQAEHLRSPPCRIISPTLMNHPLQRHLVPWNISFEKHRLWTCKQSCLWPESLSPFFTGWVQSRRSFAGAESAESNTLRVWEAAHLLAAGIRAQVPYLFFLAVVTCNTKVESSVRKFPRRWCWREYRAASRP